MASAQIEMSIPELLSKSITFRMTLNLKLSCNSEAVTTRKKSSRMRCYANYSKRSEFCWE